MQLALPARLYEILHRLQKPAQPALPLTWTEPAETRGLLIRFPRYLEWEQARQAFGSLFDSLARVGPFEETGIAQRHPGVILCQAVHRARSLSFTIDYFDHPDYINTDALAQSAVYFKLQFLKSGYDDARIVPGGFSALGSRLFSCLSDLRRRADSEKRTSVLARFGFRFNAERRRDALERLGAAGLGSHSQLFDKVRYSAYLREAASASICMDLPGNGPFCHRLVELMAIGCCIVAPEYTTGLPVPLVENVHYVPVAGDFANLVDTCEELLDDPARRGALARAARCYFDRYLHPDQLARYWRVCIGKAFAEAVPDARPFIVGEPTV
jgi:hypothetical protein